MHNLVLQSYGDEVQYRRAILTVLSFCACVGDSLKKYRIFLFTDNIPYFKNYFAGFEINYLPLDEARISEWMGERHFLHRMKIALIAEVFKIADGHLLYVDTDCFFTGDPTHRMENLDPQSSGMHKREYVFDQLSNLPLPAGMESRTFYAGVIGQEFLLPGGGKIEIKSSLSSWNAGMLLLHKEHASYLTEVFSLTDQFYRLTGNHASEQFAFSVILQSRTKIFPCDELAYHYWYRVEKIIMDRFLSDFINEKYSSVGIQEKLRLAGRWSRRLPGYIIRHKLMLQDKAIQSFNENKYLTGYRFFCLALLKDPFNFKFVKDILYHTRRLWKVK